MAKKSTPKAVKKSTPKKEAKAPKKEKVAKAPKKEIAPKVEKEKKSKKVVASSEDAPFTMMSNEVVAPVVETTEVSAPVVQSNETLAPVVAKPEHVKGSNEELLETFMNGADSGEISWYDMQNMNMDMNAVGFIEAKIGKYKLVRHSPAHNYAITVEE